MRVFITGASGFVGREVTTQLLAAGHSVTALVRSTESIMDPAVVKISGDVTDLDSLQGLENYDALIHLVGIIKERPSRGISFSRLHVEATANMLTLAKKHGIKRFLHMSANGVDGEAETTYFSSKAAAEELVRNSGLDWTIFRPSLIFGRDDKFTNMLGRLVALLPIVPIFGSGTYQLQPIHVSDVAAAFVGSLQQQETISHCYCCGGPEIFSYCELLDRIAQIQGSSRPTRKLHLPLGLVTPLVNMTQRLPFSPLTSDQLKMLLAGNCCPNMQWAEVFRLTPKILNSLR